MRHKENTERLEWLQIHIDVAKTPDLTLDEKLTFNSATNLMGPRKFLHHGLIKKAKSNKEIVAFLFNDFLLLTLPNQSVAPQFSFDKHHDLKLKLYKKPMFLDEFTVIEDPAMPDRKGSVSSLGSLQNHPNAFILEPKTASDKDNHSLVLESMTIHDKKLWMQKLNEAMGRFETKLQANRSNKDSGTYKIMQKINPDAFLKCFTEFCQNFEVAQAVYWSLS